MTAPAHGSACPGAAGVALPRVIAWEVTRSCILACRHCRAAARREPYSGELTTEEGRRLLDNIASFARPMLILTGGEPMLRPDVYDLAAYARKLGLPVAMSPCGVLLDEASAGRILQSGIRRISISLDGATAESHDRFRAVPGAFDSAIRGLAAARRAGLGFQINTTVTTHNLQELPQLLEMAVRLGASVFNPFLLVPTGRGKALIEQELSAEQYESTLQWLAGQQGRGDIGIRVTCAPHYQRILRQAGAAAGPRGGAGCMGGQSFAFISHRGKVQACGFLEIACGDLRTEDFDFRRIWETSEVFLRLRDVDGYHGRCGVCEYRRVCGGCRARAFAMTGDYLGEEPFCAYQPRRRAASGAGKAAEAPHGAEAAQAPPALEEQDRQLLSMIQDGFPVTRRPLEELARRLGAEAAEVRRGILRLREQGVIRRLGAVFDSQSLGYVSALLAAQVPADRLEQIAGRVSQVPGVTHNYARGHEYNLWFTLTARSAEELERTVEQLRRQTGIEALHVLPALAVYKIRAVFGTAASGGAGAARPAGPPAALSEDQKRLVRLLQEDLPISAEDPYAALAEAIGWDPDRLLGQVADWLTDGTIRRLGAVVRHQRMGYVANGMAVFAAPEAQLDGFARALAEHPEVSHCYRRPTLPGFPYNLYAMVHGRSADQVRQQVAGWASAAGLARWDVLFSTAEYKKASMRYFVEPSPGGPT